MATKQWDFSMAHNSDADFRAWGSDLSVSLGQVGLVQTADTGQINWATVTRPASNTTAGYEIWRFPDSSLFMRWEYGTNNTSSSPRVRVQVGTGSNGSGTLTGTTSSMINIAKNTASSPGGVSRRSWLSRDPNNSFFGFSGYVEIANGFDYSDSTSTFLFCVSRTVDANTVPTTQGFTVYARNVSTTSGSKAQCQGVNLQAGLTTSVDSQSNFCFVPFELTTTTISAVPQFFTHFVPLSTSAPLIVPQFGICTVVVDEIAAGVTFLANPIGATPRTFIGVSVSGASGANNDPTSPGRYRLAMLWE